MSSANNLSCIDYKAPFTTQQNDYRTSSYLGHRIISDSIPPPIAQENKQDVCSILRQKEMAYDHRTEQQAAYAHKFKEFTDRKPRISVKSALFIKNYDENYLKAASRPVKPAESSYNTDYIQREIREEKEALNWTCPPRVKKSQNTVNAAQPGSSKYLDLLATTNMLTYVQPQTDESLSKTDAITLWNWLEYKKLKAGLKRELPENYSGKKEPICQEVPSEDCPKRREFQNETKFVPHKGLTSEMRSNYTLPEGKVSLQYEDAPCPIFYTSPINPIKLSTETQMYGSKLRVQQFVDISRDEKQYVGTCRR